MTDLAKEPMADVWQEIQQPLFDQLGKLHQTAHLLTQYAGRALTAPLLEQIDLTLDAMQGVFESVKRLAERAEGGNQEVQQQLRDEVRRHMLFAGALATAVDELDAKVARSKSKAITGGHAYARRVRDWHDRGEHPEDEPHHGG
jgi:hypothetical protein